MSLQGSPIQGLNSAGVFLGALLSIFGVASASAQERPIKVGGGSMTFYTQSKWHAVPGKPDTFCSDISATDINYIALEHFYDSSETLYNRLSTPVPKSSWQVVIKAHKEAEGATPDPANDRGVTITASPNPCPQGQAGSSVTIEATGGDLHTYGPLASLPSSFHKDNRRYADTRCTVDRDRCERMATVTFTNTGDKTLDGTVFKCPDGECRLHFGQSARVAATKVKAKHKVPPS